MKVLDFCAGTGSSTQIFRDRGHEVVGIELYPDQCESPAWVLQGDILEVAEDPLGWLDRHVRLGWRPDHAHFSPPCEMWCVPSIGKMWRESSDGLLIPKHPSAELGIRLLAAVANIIRVLRLDAEAHGRSFTYTVENPTAKMRVGVAQNHPELGVPSVVSYCRYGPIGPVPVLAGPPLVYAAKTTDFWHNLPAWQPLRCLARPPRAPVGPGPAPDHLGVSFTYRDGQPCHEQAARGWKAGVQRIKGAGNRALFPAALSLSLYARRRRQPAVTPVSRRRRRCASQRMPVSTRSNN